MFSRVKIASFVTVLALGALAAVALASGSGGADPAAVQTRDDQPEVRTEVVRQTVHRRARSAGDDARSAEAVHHHRRGTGRAPAAAEDHARRGAGEAGDDRGRHGGHGTDDGVAHDAFDDHGGGSNSGRGSSGSGHGGGDDD